jgi:hypothetical protein
MLKEAVVAYFKLSKHFPGETEENLRIVGFWAKNIRRDFNNTKRFA